MGQGDTFLNAVIGAVITVFGAWLPFSPLFGGAVAAYLQKGDQSASIRVGALSGLLALLPFVLILMLFGSAIPFVPGFGAFSGIFVIVMLFALLSGAVYTVGLGAAGGYLGWYVRTEDVL